MPRPTEPGCAEDVIAHLAPGTNLVLPLANGEPATVMDAIEAHAAELSGVRVHQMHALRDRPYLHGELGDGLRHVSYFLSHVTRPCYHRGTIDVVPANFSEVPQLMRGLERPLVLAAASPPDRHGFFSLGTNCDYTGSLIGRAPFFIEANAQMPRTFGRTQIHVSQVVGWCEADYPLLTLPDAAPDDVDRAIAALVAERIADGSTMQVGIGAIPNAILSALADHRDLGLHTEMLTDGILPLIESGVINGVRKQLNRTKAVATFALGSALMYEFLHDNPAVELWPVRYVNDPRVIGQEANFVSINSTLEVDLLGQCASESLGSSLYSGSGGQADFARGAMYSPGGHGFVALRSTARGGTVSRVVAQLTPGAIVTTIKNTVDRVVTEHGIAELHGHTIAERARALIAIADPAHRDRLTSEAESLGFI
jgi:acyl-CoA hydrolase